MRSEIRRVCSAAAITAFAAGLSAQPVFGDEGNGLLRRIFGGQKPNAASPQPRRAAPPAAAPVIRPSPAANPYGPNSRPAPAPGSNSPTPNYNPSPLPRFSPVPAASDPYPAQPGVLISPRGNSNSGYSGGANAISTYPAPPLAPNYNSRSAPSMATATPAPAPSPVSIPSPIAAEPAETADAEVSAMTTSTSTPGYSNTMNGMIAAPIYEAPPTFAAPPAAPGTVAAPSRPKTPLTKPLTSSDPLLTRTATAKTNGGGSFGMFLQIYYDGSALDSTGMHRLSREDLNTLLNAIQAAEPAKRVGSHCGSASADFLDQVQYVIYNRNPYNNQLRAYNFTCTGNTESCDPALQKLHQVVEQIQSKINSPEMLSPGAVPSPNATAPLPGSGLPDNPAPTFPLPPDANPNPNANNALTGTGFNTSADAMPASGVDSSLPLPLPGSASPNLNPSSGGSGLNFRSNPATPGNSSPNGNSLMPPPPSINPPSGGGSNSASNSNANSNASASANNELSISPALGAPSSAASGNSNSNSSANRGTPSSASSGSGGIPLPMLTPPAINPEVKR